MVIHYCPRCGYDTTLKSNIRKHFKRKNECKSILSDISVKECLDGLDKKVKPVCEYCDKQFSRSYTLRVHKEKCKSKIDKERIKELENKVKILENSTNIGNNNIINSTFNTINFNINDFKNTNYSIALEDLRESIKGSLKGSCNNIKCDNLIELVHCNDKYPENQNILITDRNRKEAKVKEGNTFINIPIDNVIEETTENIINFLKENRIFTRYVNIHEHNMKTDEQYNKEEKKSTERILYNNRHKIIDTLKDNGVKYS